MLIEKDVALNGPGSIVAANANRTSLIIANPGAVDITISTRNGVAARGICIPAKGSTSFSRWDDKELTTCAWYGYAASLTVISTFEEVCDC